LLFGLSGVFSSSMFTNTKDAVGEFT